MGSFSGLDERQTIVTGVNSDISDMRTTKVTGLDPYNSYRFRIQAANALGLGPFSKSECKSNDKHECTISYRIPFFHNKTKQTKHKYDILLIQSSGFIVHVFIFLLV